MKSVSMVNNNGERQLNGRLLLRTTVSIRILCEDYVWTPVSNHLMYQINRIFI